jgi:hypothetical protein
MFPKSIAGTAVAVMGFATVAFYGRYVNIGNDVLQRGRRTLFAAIAAT